MSSVRGALSASARAGFMPEDRQGSSSHGAGAQSRVEAALTASAAFSHRAIDFVRAQHAVNARPASIATETAALQPATHGDQSAASKTTTDGTTVVVYRPQKTKAPANHADDFKQPSMTLYPSAKIDAWIRWTTVRSAGRGLNNLGNTCFLNAALQCLSYTPALAAYLASREHSQSCRVLQASAGNAFCMMCAMERLQLELSRPGSSAPVTPSFIVKNIRVIGNRFRAGRQEDSHEFIRLALEAMHKNALASVPHVTDERVKETSVIHQIFGGYLRSQIRCESCGACSNTYDAFLDLSVDVNRTPSLERALQVRRLVCHCLLGVVCPLDSRLEFSGWHLARVFYLSCPLIPCHFPLLECRQEFTKPDYLDGDNAYRCGKCAKRVRARKHMSVHRAPPVLSIHLKRFQYLVFGGSKINKPIAFAERLDMAPFLSFPKEAVRSGGAVYRLFAVLVHAGQSTDCGHYFSFVRAPNDAWFRCDDESVTRVPLAKVLEQQAYILYYTREGGAVGSAPKQTPPQPPPTQQQQQQQQQPAAASSAATAASSGSGTDLGEVVAPAEREKVCALTLCENL